MPRPLGGVDGERLELPAYYADFLAHYARSTEFWKLERGQVYAEPGNESWKAFDRGDWDEALRRIEVRRGTLVNENQEDAARGMHSWRVRIVALPPSDYLHWELYSLKVRDESGEPIRVLTDSDVAEAEDQGPLPDICTMDAGVMYQVIYDANGVIDHALRYTDEKLVRRCRDFIVDLYERGEPFGAFFRREIAPLPPPRPARQAISHDYLEQAGRPRPPGI
jgi:hypothetical protein